MQPKIILLIVCLSVVWAGNAQNFIWKGEVGSFFDNTEFAGTSLQTSETMAGTYLTPQIGCEFDQNHKILAGIDLIHEWGSRHVFDFRNLLAYYQFEGKFFKMKAGLFQRKNTLNRYPKMFFSDKVNHYNTSVNGLITEFYKNENYVNLWLDWTGRQTTDIRESFFMGWSGRYKYNFAFVQHFGYMYHFASRAARQDAVMDNGLTLTQLGVDLAKQTKFQKFETTLGLALGLQRDRGIGQWHAPVGLLWETKMKLFNIGIFNTYYRGNGMQVFSDDFAENHLYWGDPLYRSKEYDRLDLILQFYKTQLLDIKFTYSLHFVERQMFNQQTFICSFYLDNLLKKSSQTATAEYLWKGWF